MKSILFFVLMMTGLGAQAAPAELTKAQEEKILFMLMENQSRKTVAIDRKETCTKQNPDTWYCRHNTVKKFLIGALGVGLDQRYHRNHQVVCEKITVEAKKEMTVRTTNELASEDLRREVSLALPNQWLCTYKFLTIDREMTPGAEQTTKPAGLDNQATGISFLMNRDLNRIISRHIVVWRL